MKHFFPTALLLLCLFAPTAHASHIVVNCMTWDPAHVRTDGRPGAQKDEYLQIENDGNAQYSFSRGALGDPRFTFTQVNYVPAEARKLISIDELEKTDPSSLSVGDRFVGSDGFVMTLVERYEHLPKLRKKNHGFFEVDFTSTAEAGNTGKKISGATQCNFGFKK